MRGKADETLRLRERRKGAAPGSRRANAHRPQFRIARHCLAYLLTRVVRAKGLA